MPWHKDSKFVFRVEIGQWDEGKEIGQRNKKTDRQTDFSEF